MFCEHGTVFNGQFWHDIISVKIVRWNCCLIDIWYTNRVFCDAKTIDVESFSYWFYSLNIVIWALITIFLEVISFWLMMFWFINGCSSLFGAKESTNFVYKVLYRGEQEYTWLIVHMIVIDCSKSIKCLMLS